MILRRRQGIAGGRHGGAAAAAVLPRPEGHFRRDDRVAEFVPDEDGKGFGQTAGAGVPTELIVRLEGVFRAPVFVVEGRGAGATVDDRDFLDRPQWG